MTNVRTGLVRESVSFYGIGFYKIILEKKLIRMHVPQICFLFHGG